MKFKDYGRLSYKLLSGIQATIPETGEYVTLVGALWNKLQFNAASISAV